MKRIDVVRPLFFDDPFISPGRSLRIIHPSAHTSSLNNILRRFSCQKNLSLAVQHDVNHDSGGMVFAHSLIMAAPYQFSLHAITIFSPPLCHGKLNTKRRSFDRLLVFSNCAENEPRTSWRAVQPMPPPVRRMRRNRLDAWRPRPFCSSPRSHRSQACGMQP